MKNFKIILFIIILFFSYNIYPQGAYIKFSPGFSTDMGQRSIFENYTIRYSLALQNVIEEIEIVRSGFGTGLNLEGAIGIHANKNIGFELGTSYFRSLGFETTTRFVYYNGEDKFVNNYGGKAISFIPSIIISTYFQNTAIYMKTSLVLSLPSFKNNVIYSRYDGSTEELMIEYSGSLTSGFSTSLGFITPIINEKISLFGEIDLTSLTFSPTNSEIISYTIDNKDSLSTLTISQIQIKYSDEYLVHYDIEGQEIVELINKSAPRQLAAFDVSFSRLTFSLGLRIDL